MIVGLFPGTEGKVRAAAPAEPSPTLGTVTKNSFVLSWTAVTDATSYDVCVATDEGFTSYVEGYNQKPVTETTVTVSGLTSGTTYYYKVRATNNDGSSSYSNGASVKTAYPISVVESTAGTLTVAEEAVRGSTVTVTSTPEDDYINDGIEIIEADKAPIPLSALKGTNDTGNNLFDNDSKTVWSYTVPNGNTDSNIYLILKTEYPYVITEFTLSCDDDNNWSGWTISGGNFDSDDAANNASTTSSEWKEISSFGTEDTDSQGNVSSITDGNISCYKSYKYYLLMVDIKDDTKPVQMSGMTFSGYRSYSSLKADQTNFTMPDYPVKVMANYVEKPQLSYELNGGTGSVPAATHYVPGTSVTVTSGSGLSKPGYAFGGWKYSYNNGTTEITKIYSADDTDANNDKITINSDVVLSAVWEEVPSPFQGVSVQGYEGVYDGESHKIVVSLPDNSGITVTYSATGEANSYTDYNESLHSLKTAGKKTINYKLEKGSESKTGSAEIKLSKKPVTISVDNMTKEYGSPDPVIGSSNCSLIGELASGDAIEAVSLTRATGEAVGTYEYNTTGASAVIKNGNTDVSASYEITYYVGSLTIQEKQVTVSGIKADNKTYDGTTAANLDMSGACAWRVGSDDVTIQAVGTFEDKNAGTGKKVTISGLSLSGAAAGNYKLAATGQQTECTAAINKRRVVVSGIAAYDKAFDDTAEATLDFSNVTLMDADTGQKINAAHDELFITAAGAFADGNIGSNKTVSITGLALTGSDKENYELAATNQQTSCTANIGNTAITVSGITAEDKVYDGNNHAVLKYDHVTLTGVLEGEEVSVTATGRFVDGKAGKDKSVAITGLTLTGRDAEKYYLSRNQQVAASASITRKKVTLSGITVADKVYDGKTAAELEQDGLVITGMVEGDDLSVTAQAAFADPNVGEAKQVVLSGITLSGSDSANYAINSDDQPTATANITAKPVTITGITAAGKVYDGTTAAQLDCTDAVINGKVAGDTLSFTVAGGTFADQKVGKGKAVTISGMELAGTAAGNYVIAGGQSYTTSGDITARAVVVSGITARDKNYDGDTSAELVYDSVTIEDVIEGDQVFAEAEGAFTDKDNGKNKTVVISALTLTGEDAGNYVLAQEGQQTECKAAIRGIPVVVSGITAKSKTYDGRTNAELDFSEVVLFGKKEEDRISVSAIGEFADAKAGEHKTVTLKSLQLTGRDAVNYELAEEGQQTECQADIMPIPVTVSGITAKDKAYDGSDQVTFVYDDVVIAGKLASDQVEIRALGAFADRYPGTEKEVVISDIILAGQDGGNYVFAENGKQTGTTADITIEDDTVCDQIQNEDGTTTQEEVVYRDGEPTNTVKAVTYDENGVNLITKTTYDEAGNVEKSVAVSYDENGGIAKVVVQAADGSELVATGETELSFGGKEEKVEQILDNLKTAGVDGYEEGSVLDVYDITPEEMAYLLTDEETMKELLEEALKAGESDTVKGGASVTAAGFDAGVVTSKEEILRLSLSPTEMVRMLSSADATDVVVEFREQNGKDKKTLAAKKEVDTLIQSEEDAFYFDCDLYKSVAGGGDKKNVTEFTAPIELGFVIPEELRKQGRDYRIIGSHEDAAAGEMTAFVVPVQVDEQFNASFSVDKMCLMALTYTDDDIKERKLAEQETAAKAVEEKIAAVEKKMAEKKAAEEKAAAEKKAAEEKAAAEKAAAEKAAAEKAAAEKAAAEKAAAEKEAAEKAAAEKAAAEKEAAEKAAAEKAAAEKAAAEKAAAEKAAAEKAAAEKAAAEKAAAEKAAAEKAAAEKAAAEKAAAEKAAAEKAAAEKAAAEKAAAEERQAVVNVKAEIDSRLANVKVEINKDPALDDTARDEIQKTADAAATAAKNEIESKGSAAKKSAVETFENVLEKAVNDGKRATDIRIRSTVTMEEEEKNAVQLNKDLRVDQKASKLQIAWGKVDGAENYDVYVQYCGKSFADTPDTTVNSDTTSVSITRVAGKKLNLKKIYKIYVTAYRTVEGKKIVLANSITTYVVGRKNAVYTNVKSIKIKSKTTLKMKEKTVSVIKAKSNLAAKKKKKLTDAYDKEFRYASSDNKVATVSKTGVIRAAGKGSCTVYVYARNGYAKKIQVTVK